MAKLLEPLTPIQRQVLTLSFGLENDQHFNLAQIGKELNLSRERIRQIQVKAISILRRQNYSTVMGEEFLRLSRH